MSEGNAGDEAQAYIRTLNSMQTIYDPLLNELEYLWHELQRRGFPQEMAESLVLDRWERHWEMVEEFRDKLNK